MLMTIQRSSELWCSTVISPQLAPTMNHTPVKRARALETR